MDNEELFAVENPDDGEVGYCSILGSGGEEFGLGMFVGEDGYHRYVSLIEGEAEPEDFEENVMVYLISMLLVDREVLQKQDHEVIRSLGLRFRGRNAWPFFRSQQPGYAPWFLEKSETVFLTAAIQQTLVVADEVRNGKLSLWQGESENPVLTRYFRSGKWGEEWRMVPILNEHQETHAQNIDPVKEAELYLLHSRAGVLSGCWELDAFLLPILIGPKPDRPHYPLCFLAVETKLGLVLGVDLTEPWLTLSERQDKVIQLMQKAKQLPLEIRVKSDKVRRMVEPITSILGIKLQVASSLPMLEEAKSSLYKYFSKRNI
jgi:hypothetical protein